MGLDSVELLVAVEDAFGITFTDIEAEKIATVGGLYNGVWSKVKNREQLNDKCKSAVLFYKFRNYFETKFNRNRKDIVPNTLLDEVIPKEDIKIKWTQIGEELELKIPKLVFPSIISTVLLLFGLITIIGGIIFAWVAVSYYELTYACWLVPIIGICLTLMLNKLTQPLKTALPIIDIRALVDMAVKLNYGKMSDKYGASRQEVENVIKFIIQDRLGVDLKEIVPNASFVDDLGIS